MLELPVVCASVFYRTATQGDHVASSYGEFEITEGPNCGEIKVLKLWCEITHEFECNLPCGVLLYTYKIMATSVCEEDPELGLEAEEAR